MSMSRTDYIILDEPKPGTLAQFAMNPIWPMFTLMLVNSGAAWIWFVFNSFAQGSPFRNRELIWVGSGAFLSLAYVMVLVGVARPAGLPDIAIPYCLIGLTVLKLVVAYRVFMYQYRSFELFRYYSQAPVRSGYLPLIALWFGFQHFHLNAMLPPIVMLALR